jgi:hypothetical protein
MDPGTGITTETPNDENQEDALRRPADPATTPDYP